MQPPLSLVEQRYLTAFGQTRRYDRPGGPYEVVGNPALGSEVEDNAIREEVLRAGDQDPWM